MFQLWVVLTPLQNKMDDKKLKNRIKIQEALAKKANNPSLRISPENAKLFKKDKKIEIHNNVRNKKLQKNNFPITISVAPYIAPYVPPSFKELETPHWFISSENEIDVSIIIPCYKSRDFIKKQIESWNFDEHDNLKKEIIYVDDCCPEKSHIEILKSWSNKPKQEKGIGKIIHVERTNGGFANACNLGAKFAKGKYLIFLNADAITTPNWIKPMYDCFQKQKDIGIVGNLHLKEGIIIDSLGSEWDEGICAFLHIGKHICKKKYINRPFTLDNVPKDLMEIREVEMVTGACFMIPSDFFKLIGEFDTQYRIGYWEDSDLCMKTHAHGYKILFTPNSIIYHKGGHTNSASHQFVKQNRNIFHQKWIKTNMLKAFLERNISKNNIEVDPKNIIVYTAITNVSNNYDKLKDQKNHNDGTEFVAFLENPINSKIWNSKQIHTTFSDPNRNAKIHKILSHIYFPDKEYSLWIDGSIIIKFPFNISRLAEIYLSNCDIALFKHHERNCVYDEAKTCIARKLDDASTITKQIQKYARDGYPKNNGLSECTVLLRRHSNEIKKFNEMWWEEISNGSKRDQISFDYVARKLNIKINNFPGDIKKENYLFTRFSHNSR